jgi:parallel beta-helix repeat protein
LVESNVVSGSPSACFGLYAYEGGATHGVTLVGNKASGCSAGFDLDDGAHDNTLRGNTANGNVGGNGFSLYDASANVLTDNTANGNNNGFLVAGAAGNTLIRNTANTNASYGFLADQGASGNTFSYSSAHQNDRSHTDCLDALDTRGGNTWVHNYFGTTSGI